MLNGWEKNPLIVMSYTFDKPESMNVREEYYTMPTMEMIGSVGGTLGMLIEFTIFGTIIQVVKLFSILLKKYVNKGK